MSTSERGLVVTVYYYGPPAVGIAAQRLRGFAEHLPEFGWDLLVIAPRDVHYHRKAEDVSDLPPGTRVVGAGNPEPSRWLRTLWGAGGRAPAAGDVQRLDPAGRGAAASLLRTLARSWLYIPDAQLLWIRPAAAAAERVVRRSAPRRVVLHSSSVPFSAHFAARRAARETGVPWVAEYRDPWSLVPPQLGRRPALRRVIDRRLDHDLVRAAAAVVVTSDTTAELFRLGFPERLADGVEVVRNGFDPTPEPSPPAPEASLTLVYSGTLLDPAYAVSVAAALARLWEREPGSVRLHVYGPPGPWSEALSRCGVDASFVTLHGMVSYDEMPRLLASASALLLLQPDPAHAPYVAGKLYEYLGARRPVVAALPAGCEAERLLRDHGDGRLVRPLSVDALEGVLSRLLSEHRAGTLQRASVPPDRVAPLTRREQTRKLAQVFDSVCRA